METKYSEALEKAKVWYKELKDSGYIRVSKQLEKIFPELAESEEDRIREELIHFLVGKRIISNDLEGVDIDKTLSWLENQKSIEIVNGEDYGVDGLYAALDILKKTLGHVQGYQTDDGMLEHKAAITAVKKLNEQKPIEWSEHQHKLLNYAKSVTDDIEVKNFLESLRGMQTNDQKWSEEDEEKEEI